MSATITKKGEPDWERFGLQAQQPTAAPAKAYYEDSSSEENDLFKEDQVSVMGSILIQSSFTIMLRCLM